LSSKRIRRKRGAGRRRDRGHDRLKANAADRHDHDVLASYRLILARLVAWSPTFSRQELRMQAGLRMVFCFLAVVALVGAGCSSTGLHDLAYQTTYSAVDAQAK
jgi:hypothetical protein